ncbi:MAG: hypothetical protein OHK0054_08700 [Sideroxydans sp.]
MLDLEPTDDLARPAFHDAATCQQWLGQLQLTNLGLAQATLHRQLEEFNRCPLPGRDRLEALEVLRETVAVVQNDFARKLSGKKLPLNDDELLLLLALNTLWQSMQNGYLRCLQLAAAGEKYLAGQLPLICQRSLYYATRPLAEFQRAGYDPDAATWRRVHTLYAHIEQLGLATEAVSDPRHLAGLATSGQTLYLSALLLHRARLLGLTRTQLHVVERWLAQWQEALQLTTRCSVSKNDAPPLALDLNGASGLHGLPGARNGEGMRYLAMVPLSKQIRVKTILLQQGQTPAQADLGDEFDARACITLLNRLHACWCEARPEALADQPRPTAELLLCQGLERIYAQLARKPFRPPKDTRQAMQDVQRQIETFGRVLDETGRHELEELGFVPEVWLVEQDGLVQGQLLRKTPLGERMSSGQLVSVHAAGQTGALKLGVVRAAHVTHGGHLYLVVDYLPGQPQALTLRGDAQAPLQSGTAPGLLLPALERLHIPPSLLLPRDWFHAGRELELTLADQKKQKVRLGFSVGKGLDFERVSFELL